MLRRLFVLLLLGAAMAGVDAPAGATPVALDGIWHEVSFVDAGIPAMGCYPDDPDALDCEASSAANAAFAGPAPWTFTATAWGARLTVTDAFLYGDVLEVFDHGASIGRTPLVDADGGCGDDPMVCVLDPFASHRIFWLGAGDHAITMTPVVAWAPGAAYFAVADAPEPTTVLLLATGLGALGLVRRRVGGRGILAGPRA